jgi:hypothetical protein
MFKYTKVLPMLALMLTTFVASTSFAKVPYRAGEERTSKTTSITSDTSNRIASMGRFGRMGTVAKAEPRKECTHSHRYSWQHWM